MQIIHYPDPRLLSAAQPVEEITDGIRAKVELMFELMYEGQGVGLAAPQVAWGARIFVMNPAGSQEEPDQQRVVLNPKILRRKGREWGEEGCLSIPGVTVDVERSTRVVVQYTDLEGQQQELSLSDFEARVFQHELDHLDGILILHRMTEADKIKSREVVEKLKRNQTP